MWTVMEKGEQLTLKLLLFEGEGESASPQERAESFGASDSPAHLPSALNWLAGVGC